MKRYVTPLLLLLIIAAGACRKGPPEDTVKARLQEGVDRHFGEGTFVIEDLDRRGSHPFSVDGDDRARLLTYYDATMVFGKEYSLVGWDEPNVGSLITILGATARGVKGVAAAGNAAGDSLEVHGAVAWAKGDDGWEPVDFAAEDASRTGPDSEEPEPYRKRLAELEALGGKLIRAKMPLAAANLEQDLVRLHTRHSLLLAHRSGSVAILTGDPAGIYHPLGARLADALVEHGIDAAAFPTSGSPENIALLRPILPNVFALVQADVARMAREGEAGDFEPPFSGLRAVGALYPEAVHVVVGAGSDIRSVEDLQGRAITAGDASTGSLLNAVQVFHAAGWDWDWKRDMVVMPMGEVPAAFAAGEVDALVITSAYPSPVIRKIAAVQPVRILALTPEVSAHLQRDNQDLIPIRIPAGTYTGQTAAVETVGVTALLVTREETPGSVVRRVKDLVFGDAAVLAEVGTAGAMVSRDKRDVGVGIPFHAAVAP